MIYAGIDEAGYGPMFGPLVVGRSVFGIKGVQSAEPPPDLWKRLSKVVCRDLRETRRGRIAVNDSKKLYSRSIGLKHLERAVLAFADLADRRPGNVGQWLDLLGERCHHDLKGLPWYECDRERPWQGLPSVLTEGEMAVARGMLRAAANTVGLSIPDIGAAVVFEDRFNRMVAATRSKASTSFTFVAGHLLEIWRRFGHERPTVVVDRQSGRTHYRELLSLHFPDARLTVLQESETVSLYELESDKSDRCGMKVRFEVDAEPLHMPVALASMISKYTRELLMARFQRWFAQQAPNVKPTAGYALDAKRFWQQIQPTLEFLAIEPQTLRRTR